MSDELARLVREAQSEHRLPSIAASVVVRGEQVLELAIGADATVGTQYRVGSITKTFTASAVFALVEEGAVELDDPIGKHVSEAGDRPLTIRRLLSHSSGIQREPPGSGWETMTFPTTAELLAGFDRAEQVLDPGAWWHYSNLAYLLLGELVGRVGGLPYERFVEERLIVPAGLSRTSWQPSAPVARPYYVDPYSGVLRPEPDITETTAAGGLWSTVGDLCRWGASLRDREPMHAVQAMADPDRWMLASGLGLMLYRRGDRVLYGHEGAMPGFLASLVCSRAEDVQVAVLANATTPAIAVTSLVLALAERAIEIHPRDPEVWRGHAAPPAEIEAVLGVWWSEGSQFVFSWSGSHLEARLGGSRMGPSVFEQTGPGAFRVVSGRERGERLEVELDESGAVARLFWAGYPFTREPETFGS